MLDPATVVALLENRMLCLCSSQLWSTLTLQLWCLVLGPAMPQLCQAKCGLESAHEPQLSHWNQTKCCLLVISDIQWLRAFYWHSTRPRGLAAVVTDWALPAAFSLAGLPAAPRLICLSNIVSWHSLLTPCSAEQQPKARTKVQTTIRIPAISTGQLKAIRLQ